MLYNLHQEIFIYIRLSSLLCFIVVVLIYILYTGFITKSKLTSTKANQDKGNRQEDGRENKSLLTEVPSIPFWNTLFHMVTYGEGRAASFLKILPKYNPLVQLKLLSNRYIFINDYKLAKECFKNRAITGRSNNYLLTFIAQGNYGLFNSPGPEWRDQRKFIHSHLKEFGFGTKNMEAVITEEIRLLLDKWSHLNEKPFSPNKHFYIPVINSIWMNLTGRRASADDDELVGLIKSVYTAFQNSHKPPNYLLTMFNLKPSTLQKLSHWLAFIPVFAELQEFCSSFLEIRSYLQNIIEMRIKNLSENVSGIGISSSTDLLEAYLIKIIETKDLQSVFFGKTGEMNLLAAMFEFFIAGGDTTSHMISWSMLHLLRNPDIQEKIWTEVDQITGGHRSPCLADRPHCPYLEAFLYEVLRTNPVGGGTHPREATVDTNVGTYFVRKGTGFILNIYGIHHDPSVWGDPENFRPERFLSQDGSTFVKHEAMIAFSLGPKRCLGEQSACDHLFLFVSSIVQRFKLEMSPSSTVFPPVRDQKSAIISPASFYMVATERLQNNNSFK